jgi:hypothetical protein
MAVTTQNTATPERYFYHSFPRRMRDQEAENNAGCSIIELVRDFGLLLTPENVKFKYEHANGLAPRTTEILQRRACFTELAPHELKDHAKKFGNFALEFKIPVLKSLGAIPVFYIPRAIAETKGAEGAASTLVMQLVDAMILVERIAGVRQMLDASGQQEGVFHCSFGFSETGNKTFELDASEIRRVLDAFTHAITPSLMLLPAMRGLFNYFAYADSKDDDELGYYREREWRIAGNIAIRGEELMRLPSAPLIERLTALDADFFSKVVPGADKTRAELSFVLPGLGDKRIFELANRIIVPRAAFSRAESIFSNDSSRPTVVALEDLSNEKVRS